MTEQFADAIIDGTSHTVDLQVEMGTSLVSLTPNITISDGASITPEGAQDFSGGPITYTISAEDNQTTQEWVVTVTERVLSVEEFVDASIYPNPTSSILNIKGISTRYSAELLSLSGKRIVSQPNAKSFNLQGLQPGLYFLRLGTADGSTQVWKIIKD